MRFRCAQTAVLIVLVAGCYPVYHVDTVVPQPDVSLSEALEGVWVLVDDGDYELDYAAAVISFADDSILRINFATDEGVTPFIARVGRLDEFSVLEVWSVVAGEDEMLAMDPWPRPRLLVPFVQRGDTLRLKFVEGEDIVPIMNRLATGRYLRRSASSTASESDDILLTADTPALMALYPRLLRAMEFDLAGGLRFTRASRQ